MTVVHLGNGWITGLAADTKPTSYPAGSRFLETDTGLIYVYIGSVWTKINESRGSAIHPGVKKTGAWMGISVTASGCWGLFENVLTATTVGTGTTATGRSSTGLRVQYSTGATINSLSGSRQTTGAVGLTERDLNPRFDFKMSLGQTTDTRVVFGLLSTTSAPVSAADPLANLSGVAFMYDSSVDTEWLIAQNSGGASSDRTTIVNIATADTSIHVFSIRAVEASTKWQYAYGSSVPTASTTWTDINTVIPAAGTGLSPHWWIENLAGSSKTMQFYSVYWEQDA